MEVRCVEPGWVPTSGDCDDRDASVAPGLEDTCDGIDNDCDDLVDEDVPPTINLETCTPHVCGDGTQGPDEECDDGGTQNHDGCSQDCKLPRIRSLSDAGAKWFGEAATRNGWVGFRVGGVGDVNGDGLADMAIGAPQSSDGGGSAGAVFVLFGRKEAWAGSHNIEAAADLQINGRLESSLGSGLSSTPGDLDGDGCDDLALGAGGDDLAGPNAGAAMVFFGCQWTGKVLDATDADVTFTGESAEELREVAFVGDTNRDGFADLVLGAQENSGGKTNTGTGYLIFGDGRSTWDATQPVALSARQIWRGEPFSLTGRSVNAAGDLNADGYADFVLGAHGVDAPQFNNGQIYVFLGKSQWPVADTPVTQAADLVVTGSGADVFFGFSARGTGDVTGDGNDDLIVGAPGQTAPESTSHVLAGNSSLASWDGSTSDAISAATITALGDFDLGRSVVIAGDLNGDGIDDVAVGAPTADFGVANNGAIYLFFGPVQGSIDTAFADIVWTGEGPGDLAGDSVAAAGDINGDGYDDLLIGAYLHGTDTLRGGAAYLVYGGPTLLGPL